MKQFFKFMLIVLLSFAEAHNVFAQKQGRELIDSILKELTSDSYRNKEDTNKANLLTALSFAYYPINPDEGIRYGLQALSLATKLDWEKGMGDANSRIGVNYDAGKSDYQKALIYYQQALRIFEEAGYKRGISIVTYNIGGIYLSQSNYPVALSYYFKALKMDEDAGDKKFIAMITGAIGNIYASQGDNPKGLEYDFKALKMGEDAGNKSLIALVTGNIGTIYAAQSDYSRAMEYYLKALKIDDEIGDKELSATVTGNIGDAYSHQKLYTEALAYEQKALKMNQEIGNKNNVAWQLSFMGNAYLLLVADTAAKLHKLGNNYELPEGISLPDSSYIPSDKATRLRRAIDYLQQGLAICKEIHALDVMQACYERLSEAYKLKGDYKKAMEYADDEKVIKDSVFSQANRAQIARLENDRKLYGDSLKVAAEQRVVEIKAKHQRNYEFIGAGVLMLAISFIFLLSRNNKLLGKEKKRSDNLLLNILPEEVASQLKDTGAAAAKRFDDVTVLFTDFVNFTEAGERMKPEALIEELHTCFKKFDEITGKYGVEKIKTIGDAYLAVAGLPTADPQHAEHIVRAAIEINAFMQDRLAKLGNSTFDIRIGIHSGSVVAGIVGVKKFAYDIWGDTVNTAARMEQNSEPGKINISHTTYELVKDKFSCEYRGEIDAKGKGALKMYYVAAIAFST